MKIRSSGSGARGGGSKSGFKPGGKPGTGSGNARGKSGYNSSRNKSHSGRNSRDRKRRNGGSDGRSNSKEKKEDDAAKKGEPSCFLDFWVAGPMPEAIDAVNNAGLDLSIALRAASMKTPARISKCLESWNRITTDKWVLGVAENGYKLQFTEMPKTPFHGKNPPADATAKLILDKEAKAVIDKGAAIIVEHSPFEITSGYFARPKKEQGKWRPIVNLKYLNKHLRKVSFKMTTVADIRNSIQPDYYFVSIDLTDAYYSVPLHESAWQYVRFVWNGKVYEYHVLLFGLAPSPRVFTKMVTAAVKFLKAVFLMWLAGYIDDFLIQAADARTSCLHAEIAILVFHCLGYEVNFKKSHLIPSKTIEHLGFIFDSQTMTISLPVEKISKIVGLVSSYLDKGGLTVMELQSLVGRLESVRPAVVLAALHYRALQRLLRPHLKLEKSGKSLFLSLTQGARRDLLWWKKLSTLSASAALRREPPNVQMAADASGLIGWGGHSSRGEFCQGIWSREEMDWHINRKELISAKKSVDSMMQHGDRVNINLDSRTAAAFINRMGGTRSLPLCRIALELWDVVLERQGWLTATWLPRDQNQQADLLSKSAIDTWEVSLLPQVTQMLWIRWFVPVLDLFASWRCHVVVRYCSWYPDSRAVQRDAFCLETWPDRVYCFPPVPLISMVLERIKKDKVKRAIVVLPQWPVSIWWSLLQEMLVEAPLRLGFYKKILLSPLDTKLPYLHPLLACLVTGVE